MVLELKEYTMTSLSYKSLENPLITTKQTRHPPFYIKPANSLRRLPLPPRSASSFFFSFCDFRRRRRPHHHHHHQTIPPSSLLFLAGLSNPYFLRLSLFLRQCFRRATVVDARIGKASTFLTYLVLYYHSNGDSSLPFSSLSQKCKLFLLPFKLRRPLPFSGEFPAAASLTGVGTYELK